MHLTLDELKNGNNEIVNYYRVADGIWEKILRECGESTIQDMAQCIGSAQISEFERNCGGNPLGKEIMAWSAFSHLYSKRSGFRGNRKLAEKLDKAIQQSCCSVEVKGGADDAAKFYGLRT